MFPCLGMLARQVLSVPVSTVAVEREFSAGGNILTDYRSCLNAESLEHWFATKIGSWQDVGLKSHRTNSNRSIT
ncbi:unnamed protein product [Cuscuta campestris]|uniref:HAT C-terminal dimerisation domain-containing protein n=1 Tax=Cuscuta campestris TaxID=132261 RepID=A0A484K8D0_9ASTE|nr:unnamed protein product [Cuscuta campestris]